MKLWNRFLMLKLIYPCVLFHPKTYNARNRSNSPPLLPYRQGILVVHKKRQTANIASKPVSSKNSFFGHFVEVQMNLFITLRQSTKLLIQNQLITLKWGLLKKISGWIIGKCLARNYLSKKMLY